MRNTEERRRTITKDERELVGTRNEKLRSRIVVRRFVNETEPEGIEVERNCGRGYRTISKKAKNKGDIKRPKVLLLLHGGFIAKSDPPKVAHARSIESQIPRSEYLGNTSPNSGSVVAKS